jgi:hypothetical protein
MRIGATVCGGIGCACLQAFRRRGGIPKLRCAAMVRKGSPVRVRQRALGSHCKSVYLRSVHVGPEPVRW